MIAILFFFVCVFGVFYLSLRSVTKEEIDASNKETLERILKDE